MLHLVAGYGYLYGYLVVAVLLLVASAGLPLPVSVLLVALGMLSSHTNQLDLAALAVAGTLASVAGDLLDYAAGRVGVEHLPAPLRRALDRHPEGAGRIQALMARRAGAAIFLTRFLLTPLALPVSLLAGASRLRLRSFLLWDLAGEAVFVAGYLLLGRFLGDIPGPLDALPWLVLAGASALALVPLAAGPLRHLLRPRPASARRAAHGHPLALPVPHTHPAHSPRVA